MLISINKIFFSIINQKNHGFKYLKLVATNFFDIYISFQYEDEIFLQIFATLCSICKKKTIEDLN